MRLRPLLQLDSSRAFWDTNGDRPGSHVARPVRGTSTTRPRHVHRRALCVEPLLRRVGRLRRPPPPPRTARVRRPRRGCAGHAARAGARPSGVGDAHLHALPLPDVAVALARAPRRRADVADRLAAPHTVCLDLAGLRGFASRFYPSPTCTRTHTHTRTHAHTHARTHARAHARTAQAATALLPKRPCLSLRSSARACGGPTTTSTTRTPSAAGTRTAALATCDQSTTRLYAPPPTASPFTTAPSPPLRRSAPTSRWA